MKILKVIKDIDVGSDAPEPAKYEQRLTGRGVLYDEDKKIAVIYSQQKNYHKMPGGGVDAGETMVQAFTREMKEETGCTVADIVELGIVEEFRNVGAINQTSYCYLARVLEKGIPELVGYEFDEDYAVKWMQLDETIEILKREHEVYFKYDGKFMNLREMAMLAAAREYLDHNR